MTKPWFTFSGRRLTRRLLLFNTISLLVWTLNALHCTPVSAADDLDPNFDQDGNPLTAESNAPQQQKTDYLEIRAEVEIAEWGSSRRRSTQLYCVVGAKDWLMCGQFMPGDETIYRFTGSELIEERTGSGLGVPTQSGTWDDSTYQWENTPTGSHMARVSSKSRDGNPGRPPRRSDRMTFAARLGWLAFCSGPAFQNPERKLYPPNDLWKQLKWDIPFTDSVELFTNKFSFPRRVDLFGSSGQPAMQYRVISVTNLLGWSFPVEFQLVQYRPMWKTETATFHTNHWELMNIAQGKVLSIGPAKLTPDEIVNRRTTAVTRVRQLMGRAEWKPVESAVREAVAKREAATSELASGYILPLTYQDGRWAIVVSARCPVWCINRPDCILITASDKPAILTYGHSQSPLTLGQ